MDNCQVSVLTAWEKGHHTPLTDERLSLPKEWASNPARYRTAGIPEAEHHCHSKTALTLEMVRHQKALRL